MDFDMDEPKAGAPDWMVTFADLMSLLLTFFVLMLSFSTTEVVKFREAMGSIQAALGLRSPNDTSDVPQGKTPLTADIAEIGGGGMTPEQIEEQLEAVLQEFNLEAKGEARQSVHGVVLQIEGDLMFNSGEAALTPQTFALLNALAGYINKVGRQVDIVGHTDNIPIATAVYPSNWELSAARAGQAVRYLAEQGVPADRMRAIGQADTVPIATNDTAEGRARNRRVEFVFTAPVKPNLPTAPVESLELAPDPAAVMDPVAP